MITPRSAYPATVALLVLAACADGRGGGMITPAASLGAELAIAATPAAVDSVAPAPSAMIDLTAAELATRLKSGNIRLIDVRTDAEVAEGVIPGAEHIPLDRFDPVSLDLSDGREVVLYCRSGRRSTLAGEKLAAALGRPVEHLAGGVLAWEEAGQPLAPR